MKRKIEWPTAVVLATTIAALAAVYVLVPDHRTEILAGVATLGATLLAALPRVFGASAPTGTVDSSRSRSERRERGTMPPPAALVLLFAACLPMAACTPAQKAAFEAAALSALEMAAKAAGRALLTEVERALKFGDETAGGESP